MEDQVCWGQMLPSQASLDGFLISLSFRSCLTDKSESMWESIQKPKYHLQNYMRLRKGPLSTCSGKNFFLCLRLFLYFVYTYVSFHCEDFKKARQKEDCHKTKPKTIQNKTKHQHFRKAKWLTWPTYPRMEGWSKQRITCCFNPRYSSLDGKLLVELCRITYYKEHMERIWHI